MLHLAKFPRIKLGHFPTPLEFMPNLTRHLGGPNLYIKRDDCTGLATGGNKTRKLEFLVAQAVAQRGGYADHPGRRPVQPRAPDRLPPRVGMKCKILLEERVPHPDDDYSHSGNVMLDGLMDGEIVAPARRHRHAAGHGRPGPRTGRARQQALRHRRRRLDPGRRAGIRGLRAGAAAPIVRNRAAHRPCRARDRQRRHAGRAGGRAAAPATAAFRSTASACGRPSPGRKKNVWKLVQSTVDYMGLPASAVERADVVANSDYVGEGYGISTDAMIEAVHMTAALKPSCWTPSTRAKAWPA